MFACDQAFLQFRPEWFNDDLNFGTAIKSVLSMKQQVRLIAQELLPASHVDDAGAVVLGNSAMLRGGYGAGSVVGLGAAGAVVLAEWLRDNGSVRHLGLQGCKLTDEGLLTLAAVLREGHASLTSLDLRREGTARGIEALGDALCECAEPRMRYLRLDAWRLTEGTTSISFAHLEWDSVDGKLLRGLLRANAELRTLSVAGVDVLPFILPQSSLHERQSRWTERQTDRTGGRRSSAMGDDSAAEPEGGGGDRPSAATLGAAGISHLQNMVSQVQRPRELLAGVAHDLKAEIATACDRATAPSRQASVPPGTAPPGTSLGKGSVEFIVSALRHNAALERVCLADHGIGPAEAELVCDALHEHGALRALDLGNVLAARPGPQGAPLPGIRAEGAMHIGRLISSNGRLEEVDLRANGLGAEGARVLAAALDGSGTMRCVNVLRNDVGAEGVAALVGAFRAQPRLGSLCGLRAADTALDLKACGLTATDALLLAADLERNVTLTELNVAGNPLLGAEGVATLATSLAGNSGSALRSLRVDESKSAALPIMQLRGRAEADDSSTDLSTLNLSKRGLGPLSAAVIGALLAGNGALIELSLASNSLGNPGVAKLAAGLGANTALRTLTLSDNGVGSAGATALVDVLEGSSVPSVGRNTSLQRLDLQYNINIQGTAKKGLKHAAEGRDLQVKL